MDPVSGEASLLSLLGLDAEQDSVYRLLVDRPDSEPATLAHPTATPETVLRALTGLVESGLASAERDGDTVRYRAASPVLALAPLLESRRTALHRVEHFVTELSERHRAAHARTSGAPVEVLSGAAAIRRRLVTMQREARHEVRWPETPATTQPATPVAPRMTQGLDSAPRAGTPADAARAHLKAHETTYRVPVAELTTVRTTRSGAQSSVRFQQKRDGIPVFGAVYAVQTEAVDGGEQVVSATGTLYPELTVSTTPTVSESAARQRMFTLDPDLSGVEGGGTGSHGLTVLPGSGGGRLAWHFTVTGAKADGSPVRREVFVDAHVGGIALSYDNIDAAAVSPAQGTGVKVDGAEERIEINKEADGSYTLVDSSRAMFAKTGGQIRTYDANRKSYLEVANGPVTDDVKVVPSPSDRFEGTATTSGAVDAHLNAAKVYEYFKNEIGRDASTATEARSTRS